MVSTDSSEESLEEPWSSKHVCVHLVNTIWDIISSYIILILILISSWVLENHSCFISFYFIVYHAVSWGTPISMNKINDSHPSHLRSALWRWRHISFLKACADPPKRRGRRATPAFVGICCKETRKHIPPKNGNTGNSSSKKCQKPGRGYEWYVNLSSLEEYSIFLYNQPIGYLRYLGRYPGNL